MGWLTFLRREKDDLAERCRAYLEGGPPAQMDNYVPESMTEIIIAHGARSMPLDNELREIASIILLETTNVESYSDDAIRAYMQEGADLVKEILARQAG